MRCPQCGTRVRFNERGLSCRKCGNWLGTRPPSEHQLLRMRRGENKDDFLNDFPWLGMTPGRRAMAFTAVWVCTLVLLAVLILISFITFNFFLGIILIFVTAAVGTLPVVFLIGSRI